MNARTARRLRVDDLHLHCDGVGPTTVVLIAGYGADTEAVTFASMFPAEAHGLLL